MRTGNTILIVDDDDAARATLEALLAGRGYDMVFAAGGVEALQKAEEVQPDVILLDVMMPGMDGFEVCRRLRANPLVAEVPVILVTALDDRESFLEGLTAGADDFVTKPFDRIELRTRIATITRLNRYRRLLEERAKFERLIELSPDGILLLDGDGRVQMANAAIARMLGMERGHRLLGTGVYELIPEPLRKQFEACMERVLEREDAICRSELALVRTNGSEVPVELSAGHLSLQGRPSVQLILRDITERKEAEARIRRAHEELEEAYDASLEGWARALELRDRDTEGHSRRVAVMTMRLARAVGFPEDQMKYLRWGALLHDIGKMGIPDSILQKPGQLTEEEWVIMRKHPEYAYEMLAPIAYLRPALDIPYYHHERWDGTGYPLGLKGEEIPLAARVFAVVDVWDALCSDRPYSEAWSSDAVREHIISLAGTHLDPRVVEAFCRLETPCSSH